MRKVLIPLIFILSFIPASLLRALPRQDTISIVFLGDLMVHTAQLKAALKTGADTNLADSYDFSSYFKYIGKEISQADYSVVNMEAPLGVVPYSGYPVFSAPESILKEAMKSGIDLFLCANNHICDRRKAGIVKTLESYNSIGASFTGLYSSPEDEYENNPFIADISGFRIAFINFTYGLNGFTVPEPYVVNMRDSIHLKKVISRARERKADVIIAIPHWGEEYTLVQNAVQERWRDFLFKEGINIIIGSHPHVIQPLEIVKKDNKIISVVLYSLGNLISNMSLQNTQMGLLLNLKLARRDDGTIEIVAADPTYLWCARGGKLEKNYTVVPAEEYEQKKDAFIDTSEYNKLVKTLWLLKKK